MIEDVAVQYLFADIAADSGFRNDTRIDPIEIDNLRNHILHPQRVLAHSFEPGVFRIDGSVGVSGSARDAHTLLIGSRILTIRKGLTKRHCNVPLGDAA
jgi:hypothetical protein